MLCPPSSSCLLCSDSQVFCDAILPVLPSWYLLCKDQARGTLCLPTPLRVLHVPRHSQLPTTSLHWQETRTEQSSDQPHHTAQWLEGN